MTAQPDLGALYASHLRTLCARFDDALARTAHSAVLVGSGSLAPIFGDDHTYPFKADAWFRAFVPVTDVPDCLLYYAPGAPPLLLFHQPADYWHKPARLPEGYWTEHVALRPFAEPEAARAALPADLSHVAYLGPDAARLAAWGLGAANPPRLTAPLEYVRAVKTPSEIECLRAANRIAARGHRAALRAFAEGGSELEIALAYLGGCGEREQELPYNPIVALGANGSVLHYQHLERTRPAASRSLLIDAGAQCAGYASDVTRTHAHRAGELAALIQRFDEMQQTLAAGVHPGVDWRDVHLTAHRLVAEFLHDAGIITCDAEQAVTSGVSSVFMPHGIGHLLGLQVHDVGGLAAGPEGGEIPRPPGHPFLRLTRVLQPGMVVTLEPGVYFIDLLLDAARADARGAHIHWGRVEELRPFGGIRIEDDLAVRTEDCENLTREAFHAMGDKPAGA